MKIKKFLAMIMALTMVMNLATVAFAEEGTDALEGGVNGSGEVEFVYNPNVFYVSLPTTAQGETTYNFTLDPMGAIKDTEGEGLDGDVTDGNYGSLYFANWTDANADGKVDDGEIAYSDTSDEKSIINMSSFVVDVAVSVAIAKDAVTVGEEDAAVSASFVEDAEDSMNMAEPDAPVTDAQIYLALVSESDLVDDAATGVISGNTTDGYTAELTFTDVAAAADLYKVTYTEGVDGAEGEYTYGMDADKVSEENFDDTFAGSTVTFALKGACNNGSDWAKLGDIKPEVEITWTVNPAASVADELGDYEDRNNGAGNVTADLTITAGADDIADFVCETIFDGTPTVTVSKDGAEATTVSKSSSTWAFSTSTDKVTLKAAYLKKLEAGVHTFTITAGETTTTVVVKVNPAA